MREIRIDNIELAFKEGIDDSGYEESKWIEPVFVVALKAKLEDESINYRLRNSYLSNMFNNKYNPNTSYSPIEQIINRGENIDKVAKQLSSVMLKNYSDLSEEDRKDLNDYLFYLFTEMMNNVVDHSKSSVGGFAMAQYYEKNRKIQFAIADRGIGFLENVKLKSPNISNEIEAIEKALEKGFTATSQTIYGHERNAGFGLYAMTRIIENVKGQFVIISNNGLYRYNTETNTIERKILNTPYKGVIVAFEFEEGNINLTLDEFKRSYLWITDEEEDFY
jgi:anti-sigma regulatory factor (Ser/Thr protein kinase)